MYCEELSLRRHANISLHGFARQVGDGWSRSEQYVTCRQVGTFFFDTHLPVIDRSPALLPTHHFVPTRAAGSAGE